MHRVIDLRNGHVHLEGLGNHLRVRAEVVHTVTQHGNRVGLRSASAVLSVLDLHRPSALSGVVDEDHLEVVDAVPRPTGR